MWSGVVKIEHVLLGQTSRMIFAQNEDVIEEFSLDTAHESLTDCIGFGCAHGCFEDIDSGGYIREVCAKLLIMVTDQEPRTFLKWGGIAPLLRDPGITECARDAEVNHAPGA